MMTSKLKSNNIIFKNLITNLKIKWRLNSNKFFFSPKRKSKEEDKLDFLLKNKSWV